ncbi:MULTISPECIES: flagellar motor protein [unclassified Thiobacillus]|uniref:flagellar motor protein n=1 Tax=unclassified Thiobacillus TaxID=2646513 RepID=UPI00086C3E67|nr:MULTISPECIES: flagellar motor protein [unclassified Thiobacillus]MBD3813075.1 flagellar motor protein [Betaproteobacteria bacterium]MBC2731054.1 flagellar motor protein [Thiobacillus sp.]MBC2739791.1 flagellar motor protein [Thiobacillus sp.]MBC2758786.1 flagellar motor protein [Thiobacillus sp.]MBN8780824.1 flagellar motor protein [Thiobacillus sp.]
MDRGSLIGLGLAAAAVLGGQAMEGGHIGLFVQPAAFLIVMGGTLAAVLLHYPLPVFMQGMRMARWVFRPPEPEALTLIRRVVQWSHTARQDGLLALERHVNMTHDPFQKTGLQLLIDGADATKLRDTLDVQIVNFETNERQAARVWEAAGGYAPTLGILGAVMGLIHVMENLTEPGKLGTGIAVAFVATIYGVGLANLVFLPIANKIKFTIARRVSEREIVCDGLMGIAQGDNPRIIEARLKGYL